MNDCWLAAEMKQCCYTHYTHYSHYTHYTHYTCYTGMTVGSRQRLKHLGSGITLNSSNIGMIAGSCQGVGCILSVEFDKEEK